MEMIKCIIVEDEWYNLEEISRLIQNTGIIKVKKKYQNPLKALDEILDVCPQVAFIDIEMPEIDGITLAERLLEKNPEIIIVFITAFNQYAVQAFELNALDYIMKPINVERFNKMIQRLQREIKLKASLAASTLKIKCFDRLEVSIGGSKVKWQRAKAEEVFAYLLMNNDEYVSKDIIIENLWPGYDYSKAAAILQTAVCKIRNVLSKVENEVSIDYSRGMYCLTVKSFVCDYIEFEKAIDSYKTKDRSTYAKVEKAYNMFGNGFLTHEGYIWSREKNEQLRSKLIVILKEIILDYSSEANYTDVSKFLKLLANLVPYDEEVNYKLLIALKETGNYEVALSHYKWLERILKDEYDDVPSSRIREIKDRF